jgi:alkanesulfonate monooxygenase SsuD/methylene tetrahydromethanopterin reductase-like flavin-dependent oxidoreductase (luciferase family)
MKRASLGRRGEGSAPIYLGALNDGMLRLAAEIADGVILNFTSPRQVKRAVDLIRVVRREAALDGPFEVAVFFRATVTDDQARAWPRYQQELLTYLMSPVYQKFFDADGWGELCQSTVQLWTTGQRESALAGIPATFIQERALVGRSTEIKLQLQGYAEAGMDTAFVLPLPLAGDDYFRGCTAIIDELAN